MKTEKIKTSFQWVSTDSQYRKFLLDPFDWATNRWNSR